MPPSSIDEIPRIRPIPVSFGRSPRLAGVSATSRRGPAAVLFGLLAALAYCSWPIGFIVNPSLTRSSLASDLEAHSQPFYWVFILLDCVTGFATVVAAKNAWPSRGASNARLGRVALIFYAIFGIATTVDALVPVNCGSTSLTSCSADLASLSIDDVLTGLAVFALFIAAVATQVCIVRERSWTMGSVGSLFVIVVWSGIGLDYFAHHFSVQPVVGLQHLMLTLTSIVAFTTMLVTWTRPHLRLPKSAVSLAGQFEEGVDRS